MRHQAILATAAACATLAFAAGALAQQQQKTDPGKLEFERNCAVCHGKDGKGSGPYAAELKAKVPDLTTLAKRNGGVFPVAKAFAIIEGAGKGHGPREMPVWGLDYTVQAEQLLPEMPYNQAVYVRTRINSLVEYLAQIQEK